MIIWADKLYLCNNLKEKKEAKLKKTIESGQLTFEVYCITFASNPNNLFDIMNANELLFPYYAMKDVRILGLATSMGQSRILVKDMLEEVYLETGGFQVREYFK